MNNQVVLPFLPGYIFDGNRLISSKAAIPPTQHISPKTGEVLYYVRPIFEYGGAFVGLYIRHKGIVDWIEGKNLTNLDATED